MHLRYVATPKIHGFKVTDSFPFFVSGGRVCGPVPGYEDPDSLQHYQRKFQLILKGLEQPNLKVHEKVVSN